MMNIYEMQIEMQKERNSKIIIFFLTFDIIIMDDEADSNADAIDRSTIIVKVQLL